MDNNNDRMDCLTVFLGGLFFFLIVIVGIAFIAWLVDIVTPGC